MHRHGKYGTKVYRTWSYIIQRCTNPNTTGYSKYGGSGIHVAEEYISSFLNFYEEVGDPPEENRSWSIDRIDNDLGYIKGNMRWAKAEVQARNRGIRSDNSTGHTGICWVVRNNRTALSVSWYIDRKIRTKEFSVNKLGILEAFAEAVKFRQARIKELNSLGFSYSDKHGK